MITPIVIITIATFILFVIILGAVIYCRSSNIFFIHLHYQHYHHYKLCQFPAPSPSPSHFPSTLPPLSSLPSLPLLLSFLFSLFLHSLSSILSLSFPLYISLSLSVSPFLGPHLKRLVDVLESQVEEEGLVAALVFLDDPDGAVSEQVLSRGNLDSLFAVATNSFELATVRRLFLFSLFTSIITLYQEVISNLEIGI